MKIYAISDLHLSKSDPKPMNIFGNAWTDHWHKIRYDWRNKVNTDDVVLIPGDISWAITLEGALPDLLEIGELPGKKILIKGNHDYWWESPTKIRNILSHNMFIIQNDFIDIGEYNVCGTRGWLLPEDDRFKKDDEKIYKRELLRLEMSLNKAVKASDKPIIVMIHYPPVNEKNSISEFVHIMKRFDVLACVYGHLHGESLKNTMEGSIEGIDFYNVSCDYLDFSLKGITPVKRNRII
ncbi:3',5'-cyclic adenosine monophosphate phosphodiesterase CpdA [Oxobacter pfennigii]|uniref:3',5'-cyclic adenosine monophosphate phosphodiesterase CpdA n=1 Tax=Oxobacter pfennigii TaxID=36849 RepID=A0A0P8WZX9_9CLOT|nr:metallophosphoesterase [Oxobacter pfennigii]KPU44063.1 3',5'-cyclic adenosine monophosphate phosphodiesterase CpdA [Oxobacter pfennigii]